VDMNMLRSIQKHGIQSLTTPGLSDICAKLFVLSPLSGNPCRANLDVASKFILRRLMEAFATEFNELSDILIKIMKH